MKKHYLVFMISIFLFGCSPQGFQNEQITPTVVQSDVVDNEDIAADNFNSYSGDWAFWNNPDLESGGGVDLWLSVSDQFVEAELSAWSANFNRLADTHLSGILQDNRAILHFDDDGRGQSGNITLLFEDGTIQLKSDTDEESKNGDFTFPEGPIVLQRATSNDEQPVYDSDGTIEGMSVEIKTH